MNFRIIFCSFIIGFIIFQQDTYAAVGDPVDSIDCEIEQLLDPTATCEVESPTTCPIGQTGTYPNCVTPRSCSAGQTGTYPNCVTPPSGSLLVTRLYGESVDELYRGDDGSYSLDNDLLNRFFRAEGIAKYASSQTVVRITTNRNQFYVQTPINPNGSWSVFDTTTPGYILSAFLQKGVNNLKVSYYDKNTKSYVNNGVQNISITLY